MKLQVMPILRTRIRELLGYNNELAARIVELEANLNGTTKMHAALEQHAQELLKTNQALRQELRAKDRRSWSEDPEKVKTLKVMDEMRAQIIRLEDSNKDYRAYIENQTNHVNDREAYIGRLEARIRQLEAIIVNR